MDYKNMTEDMAREGFGCGIDCSMAVAGHCADKVGIDESTAVKAMAAFGGGMWHGETCGAVVGALMSLGTSSQLQFPDDVLNIPSKATPLVAHVADSLWELWKHGDRKSTRLNSSHTS